MGHQETKYFTNRSEIQFLVLPLHHETTESRRRASDGENDSSF